MKDEKIDERNILDEEPFSYKITGNFKRGNERNSKKK